MTNTQKTRETPEQKFLRQMGALLLCIPKEGVDDIYKTVEKMLDNSKAQALTALLEAMPKETYAPDGLEPTDTAKRLDDFYKGYNTAIEKVTAIIEGQLASFRQAKRSPETKLNNGSPELQGE